MFGGITTLGGRGGIAGRDNCWADSGGDGGIAGKGGKITVSENSKIYAYNGNMITNDDYNNVYEYDKNGSKTGVLLTKSTKNTGEYFIPAKIFAQDGILRGVYKMNVLWGVKPNYNKEFFNNLFGDMVSDEVQVAVKADSVDNMKLICVRKETNISPINYINEEGKTQGIGSGARIY